MLDFPDLNSAELARRELMREDLPVLPAGVLVVAKILR